MDRVAILGYPRIGNAMAPISWIDEAGMATTDALTAILRHGTFDRYDVFIPHGPPGAVDSYLSVLEERGVAREREVRRPPVRFPFWHVFRHDAERSTAGRGGAAPVGPAHPVPAAGGPVLAIHPHLPAAPDGASGRIPGGEHPGPERSGPLRAPLVNESRGRSHRVGEWRRVAR